MKQIFIILFIFPALLFAQSGVTGIPWVGPNKEHLYIENKYASLSKGQHYQGFKVSKLVKNSSFILSSQHATGNLLQKYDIVLSTPDKLILAPEGRDIFKLSRLNEQDQYVFENNLNRFTFVKLHFTTALVAPSLDVNISITLSIDSAGNSRVKIHDDYMNETNVVTTSISKSDYKLLILTLASFDIGSLPEDFVYKPLVNPEPEGKSLRNFHGLVFHTEHDIPECSNSFLEIQYNDQTKKCKSCAIVPFNNPPLEDFLLYYIAMKSNQSGRNPKLWY